MASRFLAFSPFWPGFTRLRFEAVGADGPEPAARAGQALDVGLLVGAGGEIDEFGQLEGLVVLEGAVPPREAFDPRPLVSGDPETPPVLADSGKIVMDRRSRGEPELYLHPVIMRRKPRSRSVMANAPELP